MRFGYRSSGAFTRAPLQHSSKRFFVAVVAAVSVHVLMLLVAHWGIQLNAIPSEYNRVLTLTLEKTSNEGLFDNADKDDATRNDLPIAESQDVMPRPETGELLAADKLNPEGKILPSALEVEKAVENAEVAQKEAELSVESNASPMGFEGARELVSTSLKNVPSDEASENSLHNDSPFLTAANGVFSVAEQNGALELVHADTVSVTPSEQRMLDQKLQHWAESLQESADFSESMTWQEQGQTYVASFSHVPANGEMDLDEVIVEVRTERDGEQLHTKMRMKKLAFSNFGQFVHRWNPEISIHDDQMTGRFHSNSRFNLEYTRKAKPSFTDKVTTASYRVNLNGPTSKKSIFQGGLETGVRRIVMPTPRTLFPESEPDGPFEVRENTVYIDTNSRLTFLPEGAVLIQSLKDAAPMRKIELGESPNYLIAGPKVAVHVSGVVDGIVAIYAPSRIVIEGDIRYQSFDKVENGGDFLGLISGRNVVIPSRRVTGPGDLTVHAAIYAKSKLLVTSHRGSRAGTLSVVGSLTVGTSSATEPRYATNIEFDRRFEDVRPPGFPVTDRYELAVRANGWEREVGEASVDIDQERLNPNEDPLPVFIRQ